MANFDMAELALKSVCPNNAMKYDDKEMPSIMVFIPKFQYNAVILCEPIIWCFMAAYLVAVYRRDTFVYPRKNQ